MQCVIIRIGVVYMTIGECIKDARKKAKLTQAQLAEKSGVATISIHQYESGKRKPRLEQLTRISNALGVHIFDLVGISEKMRQFKIEYGGLDALSPETDAKISELLSMDQFELYDVSSNETKKEFWNILFESDTVPKFQLESNRRRIDFVLDQMSEEGQQKVADYAEDILPRYRAETAPESTPEPQEGKDTTPPPKSAEGPGE